MPAKILMKKSARRTGFASPVFLKKGILVIKKEKAAR
jgi:hypothetical protein